MNISSTQKSVINSAVSFYQKYHVKGANKKSEEQTKKSALIANLKIHTNANDITAEDVRSLYVCLVVYADNISKSAIPVDTKTIATAYDLVAEFEDYLSDIQSM